MSVDLSAFVGQTVTLKYDSVTAPGNCGIAAGVLAGFTDHGDPIIDANDHSGIIVASAKVFHVSLRDSHLPQFT